ncbi:MAG: cell division protein FtsH [Candidatus Spechtbacteria bacterium RIFCSPLOWO2_12_FULL_38_22]|uniref:ATP-dependent zinc metalloprotease FtsH n=1 Tax=Candidatus Spechtbacteria bacterium RIFCSPLOWO2_12_FULL_38_22 TaxID=1802165 RepID=A0A1G2HJ27_9BACT|nr:MAG: cell division protein FtsH [Candidatus Spechtbacteria bacterium RIFCSPHIGHO2_01_FULL_38_11]OGZ59092.1 MAG: cell division protein FtsH [Candidatus Spechtbacteria bacterium RIFCSPHIGHO2_12_FULL_38_30]OGZ59960.1 MAG: cell division protein FtsH [Candidatus Spechtbacteria bacterium RIFCSPLOWO2_01_FULL_38_20]OGZ62495.1 MAG: cell division protein FtsH [Candidatus Spechtbacteria bacterium RIFCSPLOWO2_12_FULL_38_22]
MKTKPIIKNVFLVILVFTIITSFASLFYSPFEEVESISLSTLVEKINTGEVKNIIVEVNNLSITLQDDTKLKSRKEPEASLTQSLFNYNVDKDKLAAVNLELKAEDGFLFWAATLLPFIFPFLIIGFFLWFMMRGAQRGANQAFSFGKAKAKLFGGAQGKKQKVTFVDVAGEEEIKEELKEIVEFLKTPQKFLKMGARIPKGVMMMGPPGTGKTLLARAISGEAGVPFYSISGSEFVEMFVGVGAARVRDLFETAKKNAPAIIFIDEIDAVGRLRGAGLGGGNDEREQTLNQILSEMDGFEQDTSIIIIAATNRPDVLDPALLRPGRFDRRIIIDFPDIKTREEILLLHSKGKPLATNVALKELAARTPGFSGADLSNLMNEAAIFATRRRQKTIRQQDLYDSIEKVMLGPERRSKVYSSQDKKIAAYHEAGHALLATTLPDSDPVHKISIISRGRAGGYTLKVPDEETSFQTKTHFLAELAVLLGGYTAEQLTFKQVSTGASDDLKRASDLARRLVTRYGMSTKLGPVTFGDREEMVFLGKELGETRNYSEEIAHKIDQEVERFIKDAYKTAKQVLTQKKNKLRQIADYLIKKEVIERKEFDKLMLTPA